MEIIEGFEYLKEPLPYPVITLGNFDGLHRGHQFLIGKVLERAKRQSGTSIVLTFDPHPLKVLAPDIQLKLLTDSDEKAWLLREMGVDRVFFVRFNQALSSLSAEMFVQQLLYDQLHLKEVLVGENFSFGKNRAGTVKDLQVMGDRLGFGVESIETVRIGGKVASSSRIRELLISGDVGEAAHLLGRVYSLEGKIVQGAKRGRALGFPTANLALPDERVIPADGVYAAWGFLEGRLERGAAYIGTQPTLGTQERTIELHFLESKPDLYGKTLRVGFQQQIRQEEAFKDQDSLIKQIEKDIQVAKGLLTEEPVGRLLSIS